MIVRAKHFDFDREKASDTDRLAHDPTLSENAREVIRDAVGDQPFFTEAASLCFYCGEKLTIPAVMWNGRSGDGKDAVEVWLHPKCAEALASGLMRDTRELEREKEKE